MQRKNLAAALMSCSALLPIALHAQTSSTEDSPADVIISDGFVYDGTGAPWIRTDIAIEGDRIVALGDLDEMEAGRRIDATGLYISPGFIDVHNHAGVGLATPELSHGQPLLAQGLTTVMVNPDGGGAVDLAEQRETFLSNGIGLNIGMTTSHGSIRKEVMGEEDRHSTPEELDQMRDLVRAGMENGAFGMSSGLFYSPGSFADISEVVELGKVVGEYGGLYTSHIRDESDYSIGLIAAVEEVIEVAREAAIPGIVTHVKALGPRVWGFSEAVIQRIEGARAEGVEMWVDQYPYDASAPGLSSALIPRSAMVGGSEAMLERLADETQLTEIRPQIVENLKRRGGADRIQIRTFDPDATYEGMRLSEIAEERGLDAVETTIQMLDEAGGDVGIVSFNMLDKDISNFMQQPWRMTASDGDLVPMGEGAPHPRSYGTFTRMLAKYARDESVVPVSKAIHSMTGLPATVYRIKDRGLIREGMIADINVFDLDGLNEVATFTDPHHLSEGVVYLFVNGELAIDDGAFTDILNGRVLDRNGSDHMRPN
ncbi:N-acyl-D-amino-acid deacylase family protein [Vreelandella profundi]|uniref:N-acyl-D-amino-acid deacylase family protein n=1 Tax=Vreelandella profundi TaxID=2852117 RepID=UPI001EF0F4EF|nr:amidohydrolase family protein [Halomonas profundi]